MLTTVSAQAARKRVLPNVLLLKFLAPRVARVPRSRPSGRGFLDRLDCIRCISSQSWAQRSNAISLQCIGEADPNELNRRLSVFKHAFRDKNVLRVWEAYRSLDRDGLLRVLGPPHFDPVSRMIADCLRNSDPAHFSLEETRAIEELALACATAGSTEGLRCVLSSYLGRKEPDNVLRIYNCFDQLMLNSDSLRTNPDVVEDYDRADDAVITDGDGGDQKSNGLQSPRFNAQNISYLLALAIAAHACRDSFHDALNICLKHSKIRLIPQVIQGAFRDLPDFAELEDKSREYCDAISTAMLLQRPEAFKAHVHNLCQEPKPKADVRLGTLCRRIIDGFTGPLFWAAIDEASISHARPVVVPERSWAFLFSALIVYKREPMAQHLWHRLAQLGIVPGQPMWNAMLDGYRQTRELDKLLQTWEHMIENRVPFNTRSYAAKITAMYGEKLKNPPKQAFQEYMNIPRDDESVIVYNAVLNGLITQGDMEEAMALLARMKKEGPVPDVVSYNILIKYHATKGDMQGVSQMVNRLIEDGIQPDVVTFTTILSGLLRAGIEDAVQRLLDVMKNMGVELNVATYSAIIDAEVRKGTVQGIETAWDLLERMDAMKNNQPNEVTFTSFLHGVHRCRELSPQLVETITRDVVEKMEKRNVRINRATYHILLKACLGNPQPEAITQFMRFYNIMIRKRIPFTFDTWHIILSGLVQRDEWALASELMEQMLRSRFTPVLGLRSLIVRIRRWQAVGRP